jgi:hypothetical protein
VQLREFAHKQGWKTLEYIDRVTGKHSDRERFQQLFRDASQRKFDAVLYWSLDRFSREGVRETLNHLNLLGSYGVARRFTIDETRVGRNVQRPGHRNPRDGFLVRFHEFWAGSPWDCLQQSQQAMTRPGLSYKPISANFLSIPPLSGYAH